MDMLVTNSPQPRREKNIVANVRGKGTRSLAQFTLLIMLLPVAFWGGGLKAQTPPEGLHMNKTWTSNSTNNGEGYVTLETFVTGSSVTGQTHAPTDIALVLDVSGSMKERISDSLHFSQLSQEKGRSEGYYVCKRENPNPLGAHFLVRYNSSSSQWEEYRYDGYNYGWLAIVNQENRAYYITRMGSLQDAVGAFVDIIAADAVQHNVDHRISVVKFSNPRYYNNDESSVAEGNHFYYENLQYQNYTEVFFNRRDVRTDAETIKAHVRDSLKIRGATATDFGLRKVRYLFQQIPSGEDRAKVVVMFTDGSPTHSNGFQDQVADSAIANAKEYKDLGARVFAVGTFGRTPTPNEDTFMNHVSSNYPHATSMTNSGPKESNDFYFTAETPESLSSVFETIAQNSLSIPFQMNAQTIVQDQIGADFELPAGTQPQNILVYNPKCTSVSSGLSVTYGFEPIGSGNQLSNAAVTIDGDLIQVTGFNFSENWCGLENPGTPQQSVHGRKLVVKVPLKAKEGVWGDELPTNGSNSVLYPDGDQANPIPYPMPYVNVLGDVWTEVVTEQPQGFDPQNIDSPEDLAWFISVVNGRANYSQNSGVSPTPATNGKLMADIDMSAHNWVSIGGGNTPYAGTFDGNGHVVTGLKNNASKFYKQGENVVVYPGMFGKVGDGGVVKNVFVLESDFRAQAHAQLKIHFGILVDTLDQGAQLFNCEAAGCLAITDDGVPRTAPMEYSNSDLIFGGLVGLNDGGTIHSSMSMARLTGFAMGGAVGENWGSLRNSFTNARFDYIGTPGDNKYVGGLAAINTGSVANCYVRFERENKNLNGNHFGQLIGYNQPSGGNTGLDDCHVPAGNTFPIVSEGVEGNATPYNPVSAPYLYNYDASADNALLAALNTNKLGEESAWKRTTAGKYSTGAGNINGDYPILKYGYTCVASADGIVLDYANSLSDMLKRHNEGKLNENTSLPNQGSGYVYPGQGPQNTHDYHVFNHPAIKGGTVNLYADTDNTQGAVQSTAADVVVYIDENISLLQGADSEIEAYTCQTLTKPGEYWHTVSSSLTNSGIGFIYGTEDQIPFSWADNNPCNVTIIGDDDHALFAHDAPVDKIDLFSFYEPQYHWINLKRNSASHWHMDNTTENISYTNEVSLVPGKGYLAAIDKAMLLQNRGTLNNGDVSIAVSNTAANAWTGLQGYNLIGNPYQSYLDFDAFVNANHLWSEGDRFFKTYAVYDAATNSYIQYQSGSSTGSLAASRYINMHQGFFIVKSREAGTATFTNAMRTNTAGSGFRGSQPNYPLINLIVTDAKGLSDVTVLELGREENTGARKMKLNTGSGSISLRHADDDYAILFRDEVKDYQPLHFEATKDGVYTLSWNTANAAFTKLTLVDNIAGVSVDMLATDSYLFTAATGDYKSRFKIVIGMDATDPQVDPEAPFAFMHNGQLVVNGTGRLDIVDALGRVLYTTDLLGAQNSVSLPGSLKGVCILHLTGSDSSKTQKVIL